MKLSRRPAALLMCMAAILLSVAAPAALASRRPAKVVMIVLPAVSPADLWSGDLDNLSEMAESGAIGLVNSRTAGRLDPEEQAFTDPRYTPESGYVVLGSGARAVAGIDARKAFNQWEAVESASARTVLRRRTLTEPGDSEVVHLGIARVTYDNSALNYQVGIGLLGTALHEAGLRTAVVGNSDAETIHREAAAIAMDADGLVDFGNVGRQMTLRDPEAPFGVRTNPERLLEETARCMESADFVVIELGDPARIDRARLDMMDETFPKERARVLRESDHLLGELLRRVDLNNTRIIVVSPYPPSHVVEQTGNSLCPVVVFGAGFRRGLLTSGSTRVPGVIANTDIAPTILDWLGIPGPPDLVGRPVSVAPSTSPQAVLRRLDERVSLQTASQSVLRQSMTAIIVLAGLVTVLWLILPADHRFRRRWLPALSLLPAALTPSMLLMGSYPAESLAGSWIGLVATCSILALASHLAMRKPDRALMALSLTVPVLIGIDLATGGRLCRFSIMGYSLVDGSRYYGIGNEFMGAMIGASLVGLALLIGSVRAGHRGAQIMLLAGLVVAAVLVGSPVLGANTGGAVATVAAFGIALVAACTRALNLRRGVAVGLGVAVVLAVFAFLDSLRGPQHESHLGKAVRLAMSGGLGEVGMMAKRKLAMNWLLIRVSVWSKLLAAYLIGIAVVLRANGSRAYQHPLPLHLRIALAGIASGTLAALVFNDSGVVAAATCLTYGWAMIMTTADDQQS